MAFAKTSPNLWLGTRRGFASDWSTQLWVRSTGRATVWSDAPWLAGPSGTTDRVGADWLDAIEQCDGVEFSEPVTEGGLMSSFAALASDTFDPSRVLPSIREFYESTAAFDLDVWSRWSPVFRPFGGMVAWLFSRRLDQLNVPLDPLDASSGVRSDIRFMTARGSGERLYAAWVRRIPETQRHIYVGLYSTCTPPHAGVPCVKTVFPLPNGNATVVLRPTAHDDGSLRLVSAGSQFGDAGFYFTLRGEGGKGHARFVRSATEDIHVYEDDDGVLRASHAFRWFGRTVFELRYRMTRRAAQPAVASDSAG